MELAKISKNGQITVPLEIRRKLNLKDGDKVLFLEKDGRIYIANASDNEVIIEKARETLASLKKDLGVDSEEEVMRLVKEYRNGK